LDQDLTSLQETIRPAGIQINLNLSREITLSPKELEDFVERIRVEACGDSARALRGMNESEKILQQAYEGRFLFELIQNVRDANKEAKMFGSVFIALNDLELTIANTGAPFSEKGIESVTTIGNSPKDSKDFIGFKGIGFKSVQEISDNPYIVTESGSIHFDRSLSYRYLKKRISNIKEIPLFFIPHYKPDHLSVAEREQRIVTKIVLPLKDSSTLNEIELSFAEIGIHQLLLLGSIRELHYNSANRTSYFKITETSSTSKVLLETENGNFQFKHFQPDNKIHIPEEVINTLEEKEREIYQKNPFADVSLLFDLDENGRLSKNESANLYLFYPLKINSGFPFIIHSYFIVNPERTMLRDNLLNEYLLERIGDYLTGEWLKKASKIHKSSFLDYLAFKRSGPGIINKLFDRVAKNLKGSQFIYDNITERIYKPNQVIIAGNWGKGLFEDNQLKNKRIIYLKEEKTISWLIKEIGVEFLSKETIRENLEEECVRQKNKKNFKFFNNLYRYLVEHDDLNVRGLKVLLSSRRELLSDADDVFYGMTNQRKIRLPASIQKKIHFIHPEIVISEKRLGKGQIGFTEYNAELLVRRLLLLFEDIKVPKMDILQTLMEIKISERLYPFIRSKIYLLSTSGKWLRPLKQPIYLQTEQLKELYEGGDFVDYSKIFETPTVSLEEEEKLIGFGAWTIPAIYCTEKRHSIPTGDFRFPILHKINYYTTTYFEMTGDWHLHMPAEVNDWFTRTIIANWKKYQDIILEENSITIKYKSQQSAQHEIPSQLLVSVTSFVNSLKTKKWISLENDPAFYTCKEVVGMDPGEYNQGTSAALRRFAKTIKIHLNTNMDLIKSLDMLHYDQGKLENWKNILVWISNNNSGLEFENREFIGFYNKVLTKLYDFYEFSLPVNDRDSIRQLRTAPFLSVNEQTGLMEWKKAAEIYYLDDKPAYELLPQSVKAMVQPHFTNRDRNRFGQIARVIGISFKKAIRQTLEEAPVLKESSLYNYYPFLAECLALAEFYLNINLDIYLEKIKQTIVKVKGQVIVNLFRNNIFLEKSNLRHKVDNGKIPEIHIVARPSTPDISYFANSLHDLLSEILDRDLNKFQNILTDFLSRENKDAFLQIYDVESPRIQEIKEKLTDRLYSNEQSFWISALQALGINNFAGYLSDDSLHYGDMESTFDLKPGQISSLSARINFDRLLELDNITLLQNLFLLLKLDPEEYNNIALVKIDFTEHYRRLFNGLKNKQKPKFQSVLYYYLTTKSLEKQAEFQDLMDRYVNSIQLDGNKRSLFVDVHQIYFTRLKKFFPELKLKKTELEELDPLDLIEIYNKNLNTLKEELGRLELSMTQLESFNAYNKNRSLIYFDQIEPYIAGYKKWLSGISVSRPATTGSTTDPLAGYFNSPNMVITQTKTKHNGIPASFGHNGTGGSGGGGKPNGKRLDGGASTEIKDLIGQVAEKMVFEQLVRDGFQNVTWVSKNAAKAKVNPEGTDDYGYDIGYIDDLGNDHFIEVKGKLDQVKHFHISSPEVRKAKSEKEFYHVYFVPFALDNNKRKIHDLGNLFLFTEPQDLFNNDNFTATFTTLEISFI
jgi:hypothetical protein